MGAEMTPERFESVAISYGADIGRWPEAERAAARILSEANSAATAGVLFQAAALDRLLAAAPAPAPDFALKEQIFRSTIARRASPPAAGRWLGFGLGAGLAGAAAAGLAAGLIIGPMTLAPALAASGADPIAQASSLLGEPPDLADG